MKQRRYLMLLLCLLFAVGLLAGCGGGAKVELSGTFWQCEEILGFYPDGSVWVYDAQGSLLEDFEGSYEWKGSSGEMTLGDGSFTLSLEEDWLVAIDQEGACWYFEQLSQLPEPPVVETASGAIADTTWEYGITSYAFHADGSLERQSAGEADTWGAFTWEEASGSGTLTIGGVTLEIYLTPEGTLLVQDPQDGEIFHTYTLVEDTLPTPADPLDCFVAIPDITPEVYVSYPSSMKVCKQLEQYLELDAVSEEELENNIQINMVYIGTDYDHYFNAGSGQAEAGLAYMCQTWTRGVYGDLLISELDSEFEDGGSYYSYKLHTWISGEVYVENAATPVRGMVEMRYYGPTGFVMVVGCTAAESRIENYEAIAGNIMDGIEYGGGWSTTPAYSSEGRGDYFPEDDGRGDYFPEDDGWGDYIEDDGMGDIFD